jgi:Domain of unknown function (DUF4468) with TBP-like fold
MTRIIANSLIVRIFAAMKRTLYILFSFILLSSNTLAQQIPSFELTKNGVSPIVITVDSLNASELYKRTQHWVLDYYKDQKNALKTDVENQKILVEAKKKNAWFYASTGISIQYDVEYTLFLEFQDKQISISFELGKTWDHSEGKEANSYFIDYRKIWKESGEVHKIYKEAKPGIDQMMNEISYEIVNYLKDYTEVAQNNKNEKGKIWNKIKF